MQIKKTLRACAGRRTFINFAHSPRDCDFLGAAVRANERFVLIEDCGIYWRLIPVTSRSGFAANGSLSALFAQLLSASVCAAFDRCHGSDKDSVPLFSPSQ